MDRRHQVEWHDGHWKRESNGSNFVVGLSRRDRDLELLGVLGGAVLVLT
jgi:hypothetical protein